MKKIFLLLFSVVIIVSCNNDDNNNFTKQVVSDSGWVQMTSSSSTQQGPFTSPSVVDVPIYLGIGNNASGQTISYTVKQTDGDPIAGLKTGNFTYNLAKGEVFGNLPIELVNSGKYKLEVTMTKTSNSAYTIGLSDNSKPVTHTIEVCSFKSEDWVGTYAVREAFSSGTNAGVSVGAVFNESYQINLALDSSDSSGRGLIASNSPGFDALIFPDQSLTFSPCANTLTVGNGTVIIALFSNMTIDTAVFDEANNSITLDGPLGTFGPYRIELRKI